MAEQRYPAVLAVISDALSISQIASKVGVSRQTLHTWLARYGAQGLEGPGGADDCPNAKHFLYASCMRPVSLVAIRVGDTIASGGPR